MEYGSVFVCEAMEEVAGAGGGGGVGGEEGAGTAGAAARGGVDVVLVVVSLELPTVIVELTVMGVEELFGDTIFAVEVG
jgi:hypothetical protein